jgi:hypothetical protein
MPQHRASLRFHNAVSADAQLVHNERLRTGSDADLECTASGMPSLPSGQYWTKVVAIGLPPRMAFPSPTRVTLTP